MGAVRMGGVLWVAVLKRDPHAPGDRSERDAPLFRAGPVEFPAGNPIQQGGEFHFDALTFL